MDAEFLVPTPEDHQGRARESIVKAEQSGLAPEGAIAYALIGVVHALLAQPTATEVHNHPSSSAPVTWPGFAALTVLCATVVVTVWMLTR